MVTAVDESGELDPNCVSSDVLVKIASEVGPTVAGLDTDVDTEAVMDEDVVELLGEGMTGVIVGALELVECRTELELGLELEVVQVADEDVVDRLELVISSKLGAGIDKLTTEELLGAIGQSVPAATTKGPAMTTFWALSVTKMSTLTPGDSLTVHVNSFV